GSNWRSRNKSRIASGRFSLMQKENTRDKSLTLQKTSPMQSFNLSALAVRERAITLFFIFAAACAGIYAYFHLGRGEDPSFTIKVLTVTTVWPGATAQEMQDLVAEPLEKRLQELQIGRASCRERGATVVGGGA